MLRDFREHLFQRRSWRNSFWIFKPRSMCWNYDKDIKMTSIATIFFIILQLWKYVLSVEITLESTIHNKFSREIYVVVFRCSKPFALNYFTLVLQVCKRMWFAWFVWIHKVLVQVKKNDRDRNFGAIGSDDFMNFIYEFYFH